MCGALGFRAAAEVDPGVRVLVHEQRIGRAHVRERLELHRRPRPGAPGGGGDRVGGRADAEQVENHQLAVVIPAPRQEAGLRLPAVRQHARAAGEHPGEVDAPVDGVGQPDDVRRPRRSSGARSARRRAGAPCRSTTARSATRARRCAGSRSDRTSRARAGSSRRRTAASCARARRSDRAAASRDRRRCTCRSGRSRPTRCCRCRATAVLAEGPPSRPGPIADDAGLRIRLLPEEHEASGATDPRGTRRRLARAAARRGGRLSC